MLRQGICTPWGALGTVFLTVPEEKCLSGCCRTLLGASAHPSIPQMHVTGLALVCQILITACSTHFSQYHYIHQTRRAAVSFIDFFFAFVVGSAL